MKHSPCGNSHDVHRCLQTHTAGYILLPSFIPSQIVSTPNIGQHQVIIQEYEFIKVKQSHYKPGEAQGFAGG